MRTTKELLIILRDHIEKNGVYTGLCAATNQVYCINKISFPEKTHLKRYIYRCRPKSGKHFIPGRETTLYFWPMGKVEPRLAWLDDKLKRFK